MGDNIFKNFATNRGKGRMVKCKQIGERVEW